MRFSFLSTTLLAVLLACAGSAPAAGGTGSAAGTNGGGTDACLMLRLRDRNLRYVARAAEQAAGLVGPRAGAYLTPDQLAGLSGRSEAEVAALAAWVQAAGGRVQLVGPLRDVAVACFPGGTAFGQAAGGDASSAEQRALVGATQAALRKLPAGARGGAVAAVAASLAAALPPSLARFTAYVVPAEAPSASVADGSAASQRRRLRQAGGSQPGASSRIGPATLPSGGPLPPPRVFGGAEAAGAAAAAAKPAAARVWVPTTGTFQLTVPSAYGPPLPAAAGHWSGWADPATGTAWGVPQFSKDTLVYFLGASDAKTMMNGINRANLATAVMLPCGLRLGASGAVAGVRFASKAAAAECAGAFTVTCGESFAGQPDPRPPMQTRAIPPSAITVLSCGEAVARSGGRLPADACASLSRQLAAQANISAPIDENTALYVIDTAAVLPTYTGLLNLSVSVQLAASVPQPYRAFGPLPYASVDAPLSVAGPNTPQHLRRLYRAPLENRGTARGMLLNVATQVTEASPYMFSPSDLDEANRALGLPPASVGSSVNPPQLVPNNPATCFLTPGNGCAEAALDTQMVTQYAQGSGAALSIAAGDGDASLANLTNPQLYLGLLGMRPLPDVTSWSWDGVVMDPASGLQPYEGEAVLVKMAALGITVLASSGDSGAFLNPADSEAQRCAQLAPQYPAASQWVTAVGALQEARVQRGGTPQVVTCMSAIGGVITSGGGFGNVSVSQAPAWQRRHVERYVRSQQRLASWPLGPAGRAANPDAAYGVRCTAGSGYGRRLACAYGRGFPDLALIGAAVPTVSAGQPMALYGTSVTAPAFAGLVMQLNAAIRAQRGLERCRIGWMNPFLYWAAERYPGAFLDVTVGSNNYNEILPAPCPYGYHAAPGWDAVTGLGMPNMQVLQRAAVDYVRRQGGCQRKSRQ